MPAVRWARPLAMIEETLLQAFRAAGERADAVIVNGGLGLPSTTSHRRSRPRLSASSWCCTRAGRPVWKSASANAAVSCRQTTASKPCSPPGQNDRQRHWHCLWLRCGHWEGAFSISLLGVPWIVIVCLRNKSCRGSWHAADSRQRFIRSVSIPTVWGIHVDEILKGVEEFAPDGSVKLGFRTHYPQLETKLTVRGKDMDDIQFKLAPVVQEVRKRRQFTTAEDDQSLGGVVLAQLTACHSSLALVETFTGRPIAARLAPLQGAEEVFRRGVVTRNRADLMPPLASRRRSSQQASAQRWR